MHRKSLLQLVTGDRLHICVKAERMDMLSTTALAQLEASLNHSIARS
jgi:hypothetical protein